MSNVIEGTIFVCAKCGHLCLFPTESAELPHSISFDPRERASVDVGSFLCDPCAIRELQIISAKLKFYNTKRLYYDRFDIGDKSIFVETLEQQVAEVATVTPHFMSSVDDLVLDVESVTMATQKPKVFPPEDKPQHPPKPAAEPVPSTESHASGAFSSLMLAVAFKIGVSNHYGTINGQRLGTNEARQVKSAEIDCALFYLSHLAVALATRAAVNTGDVMLNERVMVRVKGKYQKLTASDTHSSSKVKRFNQGLDVLMGLCQKVFESPLVTETRGLMPPFQIRVDKHIVGSDDYYFNTRHPMLWSRPMKFLLTDFQFLLFSGLKEAVR